MPTQQQGYEDQDPPISQAVQIWAEGPEIVPYAAGFTPPYPEALVANYSGYPAVSASGSGTSTNGQDQLPDKYDLHWVAGDTAQFQFYFDGVCWVHDQPTDLHGLTWTKTDWQSQVRSPTTWYYGYWWPPAWPGYPFVVAFTITADFLADFNAMGPGTLVSLRGGTIWPGKFVWDLQTKAYPDPVGDPTRYYTRTWLTGNATVDPQVTQDDIFPPSHLSAYPYA